MSACQYQGQPARGTILLVEDHTPVRRFMARVLQQAGFQTLEAANATEGLDLVREHGDSIVLAIVDMVMPDMSGLDLAVEMERMRAGASILFTSGHVSSIAIEGMVRRSPERVLAKPFSEQELLAHVTALL
jgi:DNA-binding response OmpR family regulator